MINQAKALAESYSVTLASAGAKDMFRIVNCLISHQGKALPSGDSDLVLANRFVDFFERNLKVATIPADLDASSITTPLLSQEATCQLDKFDEVTEAALAKIIARAPTKSCHLDAIPTWLLKDPAVLRALHVTHLCMPRECVSHHWQVSCLPEGGSHDPCSQKTWTGFERPD